MRNNPKLLMQMIPDGNDNNDIFKKEELKAKKSKI